MKYARIKIVYFDLFYTILSVIVVELRSVSVNS